MVTDRHKTLHTVGDIISSYIPSGDVTSSYTLSGDITRSYTPSGDITSSYLLYRRHFKYLQTIKRRF